MVILEKIREESEKYLPAEYQPQELAGMILVNIIRNNFGDEITDQMIEEETAIAFIN
jgi:hypothetical protein